MIVSIYLLFTVLSFIWTVFLHVLGVLFGLMTTRLNKRYYYYRPTSAVISFYVAFCKLNDKRT